MKDHVFYPNLRKTYPVAERAEGIYIWDTDGKKYIDASSGPLAVNIGHAVPEVVEAIYKQISKIAFAHRFTFANQPAIELAGLLCEAAPRGMSRVSYVSGGAEATESAIKLARAYWVEVGRLSKYKVISRWQSYHGNTIGTLSIGGTPKKRFQYAPMLHDWPHAEPAYCYRCPFDKMHDNCKLECAKNVENLILREGPENISCLIIEPVVGPTLSVAVPRDGYLQELRRICDKYEILLIADEVITGMGRTGTNFAVEHWGVIPDILCLAKGLAAGYAPLGAVLVQGFIHEAFERGSGSFGHGFTYGGNPTSTAAGLAVFKYIQENSLVENSKGMGEYLLVKVKELQKTRPYIGDVRGIGLMLGVEFIKDAVTKEPYPLNLGLTEKILSTALKNGLYIYEGSGCVNGVDGDGILVAPPLTVKKEQIDEIIALLAKSLDEVFSGNS